MRSEQTSQAQSDSRCPREEVLVAYSLGTLSGPDTQNVASHMEACSDCIKVMASLESSADDLISHLRQQRWDAPVLQEYDRELSARLEMIALHPSRRMADSKKKVDEDDPDQVGPYKILEPIGEGGMGKVYKARHVFLNKIVALKLLAQDRLADPGAVARFVQEMKAIGTVSHVHIVQAFDAGIAEVPYLAMELIEGDDLSHLVKQQGPLSVPDACECIRQAALGLQHAHELGLVHRDLKPSNLMITPEGTIKILDLGLARLAPEPPAPESGASAGGIRKKSPGSTDRAIVGTPDYIAPEQMQRSHDVDIRADLYSLGCTLYYLLSGRPPFRDQAPLPRDATGFGSLPPDIRKVRPDVNEELAALLEQLVARDPLYRPETPKILAAYLQLFTAGSNLKLLVKQDDPTPGTPQTRGRGTPQPRVVLNRTSSRSLAFLAVSIFLIVFLLGMIWLWEQKRVPSNKEPLPPEALSSSLTVELYRHRDGNLIMLGEVGAEGVTPSMQTDSFRVKGQLSHPRYCALIGYNPRGEGVVCYPTSPQEPTPPTDNVIYPQEGFLHLPDPGLYTFVLLVSHKEWTETTLRQIQEAKVGSPPPALDGVWKFDGQTIVALDGEPGNANPSVVPSFIRDLCSSFSAHRAESVQVLAFSVR